MVVVDNVNCAILKKAIINFSWRPFFTIRYFPTLGCAKWSKIHHVIIYLFILGIIDSQSLTLQIRDQVDEVTYICRCKPLLEALHFFMYLQLRLVYSSIQKRN